MKYGETLNGKIILNLIIRPNSLIIKKEQVKLNINSLLLLLRQIGGLVLRPVMMKTILYMSVKDILALETQICLSVSLQYLEYNFITCLKQLTEKINNIKKIYEYFNQIKQHKTKLLYSPHAISRTNNV